MSQCCIKERIKQLSIPLNSDQRICKDQLKGYMWILQQQKDELGAMIFKANKVTHESIKFNSGYLLVSTNNKKNFTLSISYCCPFDHITTKHETTSLYLDFYGYCSVDRIKQLADNRLIIMLYQGVMNDENYSKLPLSIIETFVRDILQSKENT